jgi:outer membrane protein insertion porin family
MTPVTQRFWQLLVYLTVSGVAFNSIEARDSEDSYSTPRIKNIIVTGSKTFPDATIKSKLPYHVGERFLTGKSNQAIFNIYKLGHFKQIEIKTEKITQNTINLHVLAEKPSLKEVILVGNKHLSKKEINKKIDFEKIPAAEEQELQRLARIIKSSYAEKGYHFTKVDLSMDEKDGHAVATLTIEEGPKSVLKRVRFDGNTHFHDKKLRSLLFTREDWLLSPLDRAGTYHPLAVEQDKLTLENFYQSNGYLNARAPEAVVVFSDNKEEVNVTFKIHEGDFYKVSKVSAPGNDIFSEKQLLAFLPLRKGSPYSRELIRMCIERIKTLWGDKGYIYADVEPSIQPNDETKTVELAFHSDLGNIVHLNRINIFGNKKTRDKVVRRQFLLDEGDLLTTTRLEASKNRVSGLGYFDPKDGVNWKINRIDEDLADIDVMLKEVKTGRFEFKITYGGSPNSLSASSSGIAGELQLTERNLFGKGMIGNFNTRIGQDERSFSGGFTQPWLFDKPISLGFSGHYAKTGYDELRKVVNQVQEERAGGLAHLGFIAERFGYTLFNIQTGIESLHYYSSSLDGTKKVVPESSITGDDNIKAEYQKILTNRFKSGKFAFVQLDAGQDTRNHHTHISQGYKWNVSTNIGISGCSDNFGFYKFQFDGHYYTSLINDTDLILHVHGHAGHVNAFKERSIPFRELYNIGGQASVRGFLFGQVGPMWYHPDLLEDEGWQGEAIGAKSAAFFNAELIFPLTEDLSMKGVVFYDGGAGWNTPNTSNIPEEHLRNDKFDYRHSIGIGLRMLNPQPIRIDWGFNELVKKQAK